MNYTRFYRENVVCITLRYDNLDRVYFVQCYDFKNKRITEKDFKTETTAYNYYSVLVANWMNEISRSIPYEYDEDDIKKLAQYLYPQYLEEIRQKGIPDLPPPDEFESEVIL